MIIIGTSILPGLWTLDSARTWLSWSWKRTPFWRYIGIEGGFSQSILAMALDSMDNFPLRGDLDQDRYGNDL